MITSSTMISNIQKEEAQVANIQLQSPRQRLLITVKLNGLKTRFLKVHGVRFIAVTSLNIMEFFGYKHLEEITVRRQDDVLYKF
ncbi:hypothetical protein Tco_1074817 [Tanacetum coccineum]